MPDRLQPQNLEAEQGLLGAILIDKDAIIKVADFLRPDHFYHEHHSLIYKAILALFERRDPIDMVTVPAELKKMEVLATVGGAGYLTDLVNLTPVSYHVEHYGRLLKDIALKRKLITTAGKISDMAFSGREVRQLLEEAEQSLFGISQEYLHEQFVPLKAILEKSFDRLDEMQKHRGELRGVPTGFPSVDRMLSGLQESNLIIVAGRPSLGKSSLALNLAQAATVDHKIPVAIFSLEMSREQLADRLLAAQADVDSWHITSGNLKDEDFKKIGEAMGELAEAPLFIDDTPGINILEMRTKARRLQIDEKIKLVIVDYLQLIQGRGLDNRVQEVSEITQALKNMARELKIPVLACAQLSRAVESRGEKRPQLSDLRESGSIEQEADVVMFLYREDDDNRSDVKLYIAKHRNGPTGELDLFFRGDRTKFYEAEKLH
ncbi:MAG: replicative DNA helicase [Patescibacteria group bacterium]